MKNFTVNNVFMKRIIFLLLFFAFKSLSAQEINYDLSKYKVPDYCRQALDFNFDFSGRGTEDKEPRSSDIPTIKTQNNFSGSSDIRYKRIRHSRNFIGDMNLYLQTNYSSNRNEMTKDLRNKTRNAGINIGGYLNHQHYFNSLFFVSYGADSYYKFYNSFYKHEREMNEMHEDEKTTRGKDYSIAGKLGVGYGRIENVIDARQAVYIFDELKEKNCIEKNINEEDITLLANKITELKNRRFLDSRLRKIYEISAIDTLLKENGYINGCDAVYFTTLYDYWDFGGLYNRESGFRVAFDVTPQYFHSKVNTIEDWKEIVNNIPSNRKLEDDETKNYLRYTAELSLRYDRPLNLFLQTSCGVSLSYMKSKDAINTDYKFNNYNDKDEYSHTNLKSKIFGTLSFYPNSRTVMSSTIRFSYSDIEYKNNKTDKSYYNYNLNKFESEISFGCNYYISRNLRFNANLDVLMTTFDADESYTYENYDKTSRFWFNVGLRYSLF